MSDLQVAELRVDGGLVLHVELRQPREPDNTGAVLVSERYWCGGPHPVCCVLVRDPVVGLKAYIGGTDQAQLVRWHGTRVDPQLGPVLFPAYKAQQWADW